MKFSEYVERDALELAEGVRRGELDPGDLLDTALGRQREVDGELGCVVLPMEEQARAALAAGLPEGPLHGVPYLLKDLHAHAAGVPTTNGCRLFADFVPDFDAEITARYRRAGLVLFGKTHSPEFGLTTTSESALFGTTRNPWGLDHTAGGSSGGSAAAVAAGIVPAANASDGGGSIRIPASCCGLFGLKPTRARNPAGPDVGEGWSGMSTAHAVTRSVRDSAALLDVTRGEDPGAPYAAPAPERPYLDEVGRPPGRLRIAFQTTSWTGVEAHPDCAEAVGDAARLCRELGHEVEEAPLALDAQALAGACQVVIFANLRATLEDRAAQRGRELREGDVEPITWTLAQAVSARGAADYARAIRTLHAAGRETARFFEERDLLLTPTLAVPPLRIGDLSLSHREPNVWLGNVLRTTAFTQLFNATGQPAMSVPLHWNADGLPIGVQFAGRFGDEATLFRLAAQLETARPWWDRRPPFRSRAGG